MITPQEVIDAIESLPPIQDESERNYLGASSIGETCARKLWLQFHKYVEPEAFSARMLRLFHRGQREEPYMQMYLEQIGFEIVETCHSQKRWVMRFSSGAADGIAEKDGKRYVLEYKTASDSAFKQLKHGELETIKPLHYAQIQINGDEFECDYGLYLVVNKNTDELFCDIIPIERAKASALREKAEYVTMADKPPERITNKPTAFACKFCHARDVCWGFDKPRVNCRSCTSATKHPEFGTFGCSKIQKEGTPEQRTANNQLPGEGHCDHHSFNPYAMQELYGWEPKEFLPQQRAVIYIKPDKSELTNGFDFVQSKDLTIC